jgi:hypothetical protein
MNSFETKCLCGCYLCKWLLFLLEYKVTLKKIGGHYKEFIPSMK